MDLEEEEGWDEAGVPPVSDTMKQERWWVWVRADNTIVAPINSVFMLPAWKAECPRHTHICECGSHLGRPIPPEL